MFKVPMMNTTRGVVLRRLLTPSAAHLEGLAASATNARSYHGQIVSQEASTETKMALPPNLMFDYKSSFAPQKETEETAAAASLANEEIEDDESSTDSDLDEEYLDDEDDDDESPLYFRANASTHRPVMPLPLRLQVPIHDCKAEETVGTLWLDSSVFGVEDIRVDLITQNVNYIRNKIRGFRKAKSKTISEKSGSGRKVRNQKGGGIARAGHSRPAHWRGGAKAHGPKNTKNYGNTKLNKNVKTLAMRSMLSQKLKEGNLIVVTDLHLDSHKTRPWASTLENYFGVGKALKKTRLRNNPDLEPTTSALILDHYLEDESKDDDDDGEDYHASYHGVPINLWVASSNIPRVTVRNHRFLNVYDCLKNEKLIVTLSALEQIEDKWKE